MPIEINHKDKTYTTNTLIWDRDSLLIDFENYWSRLAGLIAQLSAEKTTSGWDGFNLARTGVIKSLGINPETAEASDSSPIKILPMNAFSILLTSKLVDIAKDKSYDELNIILKDVIKQALEETSKHINDSIKKDSLDLINELSGKVTQILLTNDSKENNNKFTLECSCKFDRTIVQANKNELESILNSEALLITNNSYLAKLYEKKSLLLEGAEKFSWKEIKDNSKIIIHIDGASRGNPGPASIGVAIYSGKELTDELSEEIGMQTNNFAEYSALIRALEFSLSKGYSNIEIKSDSELVVKQINKIYKVKDAAIKELFTKASSLIEKIDSVKISHVRREDNQIADKLANQALD